MNAQNKDVVLVQGFRTPFVKAGTKFKDIHPAELGSSLLREMIDSQQKSISSHIDEVIIGNVGNPPDTANISRVIALRAGLPQSISAFTVSRNCASGMEGVTTAVSRIQSNDCSAVLAGGVESMSSYPLIFSKNLTQKFQNLFQSKTLSQKIKHLLKIKLKDLQPRISLVEGLTDPFVGLNMGDTAEVLAKEFGIPREAQDEFALQSHQKASQSLSRLSQEIRPFLTTQEFVKEDHGPRAQQTLDKLRKLRPYFDRKHGSVTVGNACPITDGACFLFVMDRSKAESLGYSPKIRIRSFAYAGCSPKRMGLGPLFATSLALKKANLSLKDIGLIEINEAFAAQVLACLKAFSSQKFAKEHLNLNQALGEINPSQLNVNGGAIALGHPVGATGARLILTLMHEMKIRKTQFGLATLCIGGGQGGAVILEQIA